MPYIAPKQRKDFESFINIIPKNLTPGEVNYCITKIIQLYLADKVESYSHYNSMIGVLECCKLELYRRNLSKYEDKKIEENGDVY